MKGFAKYKQNIDSILENSYEDKDKFKNNLSVIMGTMKFSKSLREFFVLYNEIESKKFESQNESRDYITEAVITVKKAEFPPEMKFDIDGFVQGQDDQGRPVQGQIVKVEDDTVNLDMNHPLAGEDLNFEIELVEVVA